MIIREIIVYLEDMIVGKTWGNPAKYAIIIMGSVMFWSSKSLQENATDILTHYNLIKS